MNDALYNRFGGERIGSRQIDELIGIAKGIAADGIITHSEVEFLEKWLVSNMEIADEPLLRILYKRVRDILSDGIVDDDEKTELLDTLNSFSNSDFELGESMRATTLPLCNPAPTPLLFEGSVYTFTGTFNYGQRKDCELAITSRGASAGKLTLRTNVLVIGSYATESWKHSSFGNKILKAVDWRDQGKPISIISEDHWRQFL